MTTTTTTTTATLDATASADLVRTAQTALDRLNKTAAHDDLDALLSAARRSLLLVDCSGSMSDYIAAGGRKIDALRKVVTDLRASGPCPVAAFGVGYYGVEMVEAIPEPEGSTPLDRAIEFGQQQGATHLVVVTDGQPNDEGSAFDAARRFANPVDVFYIGDGRDRGYQFAQELARMTGGVCHLTDMGKPKELAGSIRLLLGDGSN